MTRQFVVGIVLAAFVNFLVGCTYTERAQVEEAKKNTEKITELVLTDGSKIKCDARGAAFRPNRFVFQDSSSSVGGRFFVAEDSIRCRTSRPESISPEALDTAHVAEVVLRNSLLVSFQSPGARFDTATQMLGGTTLEGMKVAYQIHSLRSIRSTRPATISLDELKLHAQQPVYEVVNKNSFVTTFDSSGWFLSQQPAAFVLTNSWGKTVVVPSDNVLYATIERANVAGTILATLGVIFLIGAVIVIIALATKQSCPFVYSYTGQRYVFDAEPLGGAICRGLARTDISKLDSLKPVDGQYKLLVRNEVPETQYIDRMRLLVVDHPANTSVFPDLEGKFHSFTRVQGALSAVDENGKSLLNFLSASDGIVWQTHLPSASKEPVDPVRHTLTVTLPKQAGAQRAWLVTNIGTSSWGSNMIRKTVEYRGNGMDAWLKQVSPGSPAYTQLYSFLEREEMYHLKTWVKEGNSWKQEAVILGQGPLISEDRVYQIDVSHVTGDSLVLQFHPPKGFWTMDYIGVSYEEPSVMTPMLVDAQRAEDQRGESILDSLATPDGSYYTMPDVGDWAELSFPVPSVNAGDNRSIYLQTSGYYELHPSKDRHEQLARLVRMQMNAGQIVREAMEEFRAWQAQMISSSDQDTDHGR